MTARWHRGVALLIAATYATAACSGTPTASQAPITPAPGTPAPTTAPTVAPATSAPAVTGPSLQSITGAAPPAVPAGTTWIRIGDDAGAFTFEVPSTWTQHQTVPWAEEDGSSSGSIVVAGPEIGGLGSDFSQPGVAIGVSSNPTGRTARQVVDADNYATVCTGTPAEEENGDGYTAAYRFWSPCGGRDEAFLIVVVIAPAGTQALFAVIFQGSSAADLGYVEHVMGSLQTGGGTPTPTAAATTPAATTPPGNAQGWTASVTECLSQINDAIAVGIITNVDTRSHGYRVYVRFLDPTGLLIGEDYWNTPTLDPGQSYEWEVRHLALNGAKLDTCNLSEVLVRN